MDRDASTKTSPGSTANVRKLTLSCSRCRASKLKCDRKEPCLECIKRKIGHLCNKEERQPRAKKAKTSHVNINDNQTNTYQDQDADVEDVAQRLEHFVEGTPHINSHMSAASESMLCSVAPDYPNMYWSVTDDRQKQGEKLALIREIVDAMPELDMIRLLCEVFVTRCQAPLGNVTHTQTFMKQVEIFCSCLGLGLPEAQVAALASMFSMDVLACQILALVLALALHPSPSTRNWSPTPPNLRVEELRASDVHIKSWRSLAIRCLSTGASLFCGSISSLQAVIMLLLDGRETLLTLDATLVTAISGAQKLGLHRLGEAKLEPFASPTASIGNDPSTIMGAPQIRTEVGIRCWWALAMRDWSRGQVLGYYSIHASQFNTRMPLHINDDDLCLTTSKADAHGHIAERPRSEFTMLSYTIHALEIAIFARESIDLRSPLRQTQRQERMNETEKMRNHLSKRYESFIASLPPHFRLGSTVALTSTGPMAAISVHRWMLHQQLWSLFLRLHRASLRGNATCQLLAQNIISTHSQMQTLCAVCGSLSTNDTQLFSAAIVLLIDLLFSSEHGCSDLSNAQLSQSMTRDKIREAIELLRTASDEESFRHSKDLQMEGVGASSQRSVIALEALMNLEKEDFGNNEETRGAIPGEDHLDPRGVKSDSIESKSLRTKVMEILEGLQGNDSKSGTTMDQANLDVVSALNTSVSLETAPGGHQDLDMLPVIPNEPNSDLWRFLDFPSPEFLTENGFFSATADLPAFIDSIPIRPPEGSSHEQGDFNTIDFANM